MSFGTDFINSLREGNTNEAINTLKENLKENLDPKLTESRNEMLKGYGFKVQEAEQDSNTKSGEESESQTKDGKEHDSKTDKNGKKKSKEPSTKGSE